MLALFSVTLFVSAVLLFSVQPMVGKMVLPQYGGTPAVWTTCMLFFQALLLAGYSYTHVTSRWLPPRRQAVLHLLVMVLPLLVLPIGLRGAADPSADVQPVFQLLWQLVLVAALPFFVVSTTAPLLQRWFVETRHAASSDPYFLYSSSNVGSLLALLGYPFLAEPLYALAEQSQLWAGGYVALAVLTLCAAGAIWLVGGPRTPVIATPRQDSHETAALSSSANANSDADTNEPAETEAAGSNPQSTADVVDQGVSAHDPATRDSAPSEVAVTHRRRLHWLLLAFVPSSLMLGVTTHITTDIASVPLFWVLPLALFLLTFVFVFARKRVVRHELMIYAYPYAVLVLLPTIFLTTLPMFLLFMVLHLLLFFVVAMVCHGELQRLRPPAVHLTEFYLWMSVGGVLGGVFNALVAPQVFQSVAEYPLVLVASAFLYPGPAGEPRAARFSKDDLLAVAVLAVVSAAAFAVVSYGLALDNLKIELVLVFALPAIMCFGFKHRPLRFACGFAIVVLTVAMYQDAGSGNVIHSQRGFFGVKRVTEDDEGFHTLVHGGTSHGIQRFAPEPSNEPLSYYHPSGPAGDLFEAAEAIRERPAVGVIGLGTGSMASYAKPNQQFTFFEIDPGVVEIASDPQLFTFLDECRGELTILLGDARVQLERRTQARFDVLIFDAFSSDAIPAHLLTKEALDVYLTRLRPRGFLAFHISNRHVDLEPLLAGLADEAGLLSLARSHYDLSEEQQEKQIAQSKYMVVARNNSDIQTLVADDNWEEPELDPNLPLWTDQYSNILSVLK